MIAHPSTLHLEVFPKQKNCIWVLPPQPLSSLVAHEKHLMSAFRDFVAASGHFTACQHICSGEPLAPPDLPQSSCSIFSENVAIQPMMSRMLAYSPFITILFRFLLHKCLI